MYGTPWTCNDPCLRYCQYPHWMTILWRPSWINATTLTVRFSAKERVGEWNIIKYLFLLSWCSYSSHVQAGNLRSFLNLFVTLGINDSALILNLSRSEERAFHISRFDIDVTIIAIQNKKPSAGIIYRWNKGKHLVCIISAQIDYFSLETGPFRAATKRLVFSRSRAMISGHFSSGLL